MDQITVELSLPSSMATVMEEAFIANKGDQKGGRIYLDSTVAAITSNAFVANASPVGVRS